MLEISNQGGSQLNNRVGVVARGIIVKAITFAQRNGFYYENQAPTDTASFTGSIAATATQALWTPPAGFVFDLYKIVVQVAAAITSLQILFGASVILDLNLAANQIITLDYNFPGFYIYPATTVIALKNNTLGAVNVSASVFGRQVAA